MLPGDQQEKRKGERGNNHTDAAKDLVMISHGQSYTPLAAKARPEAQQKEEKRGTKQTLNGKGRETPKGNQGGHRQRIVVRTVLAGKKKQKPREKIVHTARRGFKEKSLMDGRVSVSRRNPTEQLERENRGRNLSLRKPSRSKKTGKPSIRKEGQPQRKDYLPAGKGVREELLSRRSERR